MDEKHVCFNCGQEIRYDDPVTDEELMKHLESENIAFKARINLVKHELQRVIKAGGAEPSWAQELLDKLQDM